LNPDEETVIAPTMRLVVITPLGLSITGVGEREPGGVFELDADVAEMLLAERPDLVKKEEQA
jgi:hypothetical protein